MRLMKAKELSKEIGIPRGTLYDWGYKKIIPEDCYHKPTGGTLLFNYDEFLKWLTGKKKSVHEKIGFTL